MRNKNQNGIYIFSIEPIKQSHNILFDWISYICTFNNGGSWLLINQYRTKELNIKLFEFRKYLELFGRN